MQNSLSFILIILLSVLFSVDAIAQEKADTRRHIMQTNELIKQLDGIKEYLQKESKFRISFPGVCKVVEENSDARNDYFLKAKKAFQEEDPETAVRALQSAREIIRSDVRRISEIRDREVTREILQMEQKLGRSVDTLLRDI